MSGLQAGQDAPLYRIAQRVVHADGFLARYIDEPPQIVPLSQSFSPADAARSRARH
jgi:hypothetical protein